MLTRREFIKNTSLGIAVMAPPEMVAAVIALDVLEK